MNDNLSTIKTKIEAASSITVQGADSTALTAKETALQAAIAEKTAAVLARDAAIVNRDQAVNLKNTAIAQRDNAIAALTDNAYYLALEAKDATIADLTARLNAANAAAIATEHDALEAYKDNDISLATIADVPAQTATGSAISPKPVVTSKNGTVLTEHTDFEYSYTNNTAVGTAIITVTGIGTRFKSKTKPFTINPVTSGDSDDDDDSGEGDE